MNYTPAMSSNGVYQLPRDVEAKLQSAEDDLQHFRETGNPQHLYYAEPKLRELTEMQRLEWTPDVETK